MKTITTLMFLLLLTIIECNEKLRLILTAQDGSISGPVCLDGSPPGYYIRLSNTNSSKWLIYHEGGGWCTSLDDCVGRSKTILGSTINRPSEITSNSLTAEFSNDANLNMLMHDWNKVLIIYCDGGSFTGNNDTVTNHKGNLLYFRGRKNLQAIKKLLDLQGLINATDIVISGCSAGGLAVYLNIDWWRENISPHIKVTGLPIDGYFLDRNDIYGFEGYSDYMRWIYIQMNSSTNNKCQYYVNNYASFQVRPRKNVPAIPFCIFPEYISQFIETPIFVLNSKFNYHTIIGTGSHVNEFGYIISSSINKTVHENITHRGCFVDICVHHCTLDVPCIGNVNSTYAFKLFYGDVHSVGVYNDTHLYIDDRLSPCLFCCSSDRPLLILTLTFSSFGCMCIVVASVYILWWL